MEEHPIAAPGGESYAPRRRRKRALSLEIGQRRFPILTLDADSCTIETPPATTLRGYASVLDGEDLLALCLITLAGPAGQGQRIDFKQWTEARRHPPADYAPCTPDCAPDCAP